MTAKVTIEEVERVADLANHGQTGAPRLHRNIHRLPDDGYPDRDRRSLRRLRADALPACARQSHGQGCNRQPDVHEHGTVTAYLAA